MKTGIYTILNVANGHRYVGSAVDMRARFRQHRSGLMSCKHPNRHLQSAWNKYGPESFVFAPELICDERNLLWYEQIVIDGFHPEYNIAKVAGSRLGCKVDEPGRIRISASLMGRKQSAETIEKRVSKIRGRPRPEAVVMAMSDRMARQRMSAEANQRSARARAALSDKQVLCIRSALKRGLTESSIAIEHGVSRSAIANIKRGISYRWVA